MIEANQMWYLNDSQISKNILLPIPILLSGDVTAVDPYLYQNRVGTATRISQELPNCNWLEEKILRAAEAG